MKVPLVDLHKQYLSIKEEIDTAIQQVIENSQFILGNAVRDFEDAFAKTHQSKHCIAVGSGTDALHSSLWALGIGKGDEVITTPFTFIATIEAISLAGAKPVFVDIDLKTYTMDAEKLEDCLRSNPNNVRVVIPIHLYGQPAAMDSISEIATKYKIKIIEDACQSHLAQYEGKYVGNFGSAGCFSFYPTKNLGAFGEGGAVTTNVDEIAKKVRLFRDHGQVEKYMHEFWGHNYRMDGIQGAVLGVKLKYLQQWTDRRRTIAQTYKRLLSGVSDIILPSESPNTRHVYHLFVIRTKQRARLKEFLSQKEISTTIAYPLPLHLQQASRSLGYARGDFPNSEAAADECISLPLYSEMSDEQIEYVASNVKSFFQDKR